MKDKAMKLIVVCLVLIGILAISGGRVLVAQDVTPPQINMTEPLDGAYVNTADIVLRGQVIDESSVTLTVNGSPVTLQPDRSFEVSITLDEGSNSIALSALDSENNQGDLTITVVVDTLAPQLTITGPEYGSFFTNPEITLEGEVVDDNTVTLTINDQPVPPSSLNGTQLSHMFVLAEGENDLKIVAVDAAQNRSQETHLLFLDATAPILTVTTPVVGTITNLNQMDIVGIIDDSNPQGVTLSGGSLGSPLSGEIMGTNFYFRDVPLVEGDNVFTVTGTDRSGGTGQTNLTILCDITPPQLSISQPLNSALLSTISVLVKGTVTDERLKEVKVNHNRCELNDNEFSVLVNLMEGDNTLQVTASDTAGNITTENLVVTVDTKAPIINFTNPVNDALLNTSTITVTGQVDDSHLTGITINGQAATLNNNQFTLENFTLQEGVNEIVAEGEDSVGNSITRKIIVTVDTLLPQILSVQPADQVTEVPPGMDVRVELSETIDLETLQSSSFYVQSGGITLPGTLSMQETTLIFKPDTPLPDGVEINVFVTNGIKDSAGNALENPYTGSFFTDDVTAPSIPDLNALPETTSLTSIDLEGTAEAGSTVSVTGGLNHVTGTSNEQGQFTLTVPLKSGQLNHLCVTARDEGGNESKPYCLSIYQENTRLTVLDAIFENNEIDITFSKPIDIATFNNTNVKVTSASGEESTSFSTDSNNTVGKIQPSTDLTTQMIILEVNTGITDAEGIVMSYPFTKVFNQTGGDVVVQGEVYDDYTGLPLAGARVELISLEGAAPPAPAPMTTSTAEGKYVLVLPAGNCVIQISKENYTISHRVVIAAAGFSTTVFDSRLTPILPQVSEEKNLVPAGGTILNPKGVLLYPAGTVDQERSVQFIAVGGQSLQGRLPCGWSPLAAFDLRVSGDSGGGNPLLQTCEIRTQNQWADITANSLVLAHWNENEYLWKTASLVSVSVEDIIASITQPGQYVFLLADRYPQIPTLPAMGETLPGVNQSSIPTEITATLDFNPDTIYPGETSVASLTIHTTTPISSGAPVQAKVNENYELLSGSIAIFSPYTADLTAYNYGSIGVTGDTGTTTYSNKLDVHLSPNSQVELSELKIGTIHSDLVRYSAGAMGIVVGPDGGIVSGDGNVEITIAAGAVSNPIAVSLKKIDPTSISLSIPPGFELIGAIELSLGGANLNTPATLSLGLTQAEFDQIPTGSYLLTLKEEKISYELAWAVNTAAKLESGVNKILTTPLVNIDAGGGTALPFLGIKKGGTYLFIRSLSPLGYITGTVSEESQPLNGAVISVENHDIKSIGAADYVQVGFLGSSMVEALNIATRDTGSASANIQNSGEIITLNLEILKTGPQILGVTPEHDSTQVPLNSKVTFSFSEPIKASTFNDSVVMIKNGSQTIAGAYQLSSDGKKGEFVPHEDFPSNSTIQVTVTTELRDLFSTPMAAAFASSFYTLDAIPPESDPSKISIQMPEAGVSNIIGDPGSVEPGATVIVFNERTGISVTVSGLSDGSFSTSIGAEITDKVTVRILDAAGNESMLGWKPFISADGMQIVLGEQEYEYVNPEGMGIKLEEGTFAEPTVITIKEVTDTSVLAPMPEEVGRLQTMNLDFGGKKALKPIDMSIPAPAGMTEASNDRIFFAREIEILGEKYLMPIDSAVVRDGRIHTACAPFDDEERTIGGCYTGMEWRAQFAPMFISGSGMGAMYASKVAAFASTPTKIWVIPVTVNTSVPIKIVNVATGEVVLEKMVNTPPTSGQVFDFMDMNGVGGDPEPSIISKASGLLTLNFDVSSNTVTHQGITITPNTSEETINISGDPGTAAEKGDKEFARVYVYKLKSVEDDQGNVISNEYKEIKEITTDIDGSFSSSIPAKTGDKMFVAVEKGNVLVDQQFVLTFSAPLSKRVDQDNLPISLLDITEGEEVAQEVDIESELTPSRMEVIIRPKNQLKENHTYIIKTAKDGNQLEDMSSNKLNVKCPFRTKRSYAFYNSMDDCGTTTSSTCGYEVYDTVLIGKYLFIAAGSNGLRALDVSNPLNIKEVYNSVDHFYVPGKFRGVGHYKKDMGNGEMVDWLVAVGGGARMLGFVKCYAINEPATSGGRLTLSQVKSQVISDTSSDMVTLDEGQPRSVEVLGQYAFITITGYGAMVVDIEGMTPQTDRRNVNAIIRTKKETNVRHIIPYTKENGDNKVFVLMLVNRYGLKILDMNGSSGDGSGFGMVEVGNYPYPGENQYFTEMAFAQDYWVDKNGNGEEDDGELRDLVFYAAPNARVNVENQIIVVDITKHTMHNELSIIGSSDMVGMNVVEKGDTVNTFATGISDLSISKEDQILYVADTHLGLLMLDMRFKGGFVESFPSSPTAIEEHSSRFLSKIATNGTSRRGLLIEDNLNIAIVGQEKKGINIIKVGNPEVKFVYEGSSGYKEVSKIAPYGLKTADNPKEYPDEIYIMVVFPAGFADVKGSSGQALAPKCDVEALTSLKTPIIPWNDEVKTYLKDVELTIDPDKGTDLYKVYVSDPIRVTWASADSLMEAPQDGEKRIISGDFLRVTLQKDYVEDLLEYSNAKTIDNYLSYSDAKLIFDIKPSLQAQLIDRDKNFAFNDVPTGEEEKPNSPKHNPPQYANVMLDTGEYVHQEKDLYIPGRGIDFAITRTYRSQAAYSGVVGWGWDHNYNKRLQLLYNGDIIYFDGTGRRERFKAKKETAPDGSESIKGYETPKGWFVDFGRTEDGMFIVKYADKSLEKFDGFGRLIMQMDRNQNKMEFLYNFIGQLSTIVDTMGRVIELEYYPFEKDENTGDPLLSSGRLKSITDFADRMVVFEYNDNGDLWKTKIYNNSDEQNNPINLQQLIQYTYANTTDHSKGHDLETVIDPRGNEILEIVYDTDKVTKLKVAQSDGENSFNIDFTIGTSTATVTDGEGYPIEFSGLGSNVRNITYAGVSPTTYTYTDEGLLKNIQFPEGNQLDYTYDDGNEERRSQGNLLSVKSIGNDDGTIQYDYTYDSESNQVDSITDGNRKGTTITPDKKGNIESVELPSTDSGTPKYQYTYNDFGQLETITDPMGNVTEYVYHPEESPSGNGEEITAARMRDGDTGGYLAEIIQTNGAGDGKNITHKYTYDKLGNVTQYEDGEGVITEYDYKGLGSVINQFGLVQKITQGTTSSQSGTDTPVNLITNFKYDANGNVTERSAQGIKTTYQYDSLNRPHLVTQSEQSSNGLSQQYKYDYDKNSNLKYITYPKGNVDEFQYDNRNLLHKKLLGKASKTGAFLTEETYEYSGNGTLETYIDGEGNTFTYDYDSHGRFKWVLDPLSNKLEYFYDGNSNVISQASTGADGKTQTQSFTYDNLNQMTHHQLQTDGGLLETKFGFNTAGHMTSVTTPNNKSWTITPTASGLPGKITDPIANEDMNTFDKRGWVNKTVETRPGLPGLNRNFAFNGIGNQILSGDSIERDHINVYSQDKKLLQEIKGPEDRSTLLKYDDLNRVKSKTRKINSLENSGSFSNGDTSYEYDGNGNLWIIKDDGDKKTEYTYDNKDRLVKITYHDGLFEEFTYNGRDQIDTYTDLNGKTIKHDYDIAGRLIKRSYPAVGGGEETVLEEFEYDGLNRLTKAKTTNGDSEVIFEYTTEGRLDLEIQKIKNGSSTLTYTIDYTYDDAQNKTTITYPSGKTIEITRDDLYRIDTITSGSETLVDYDYVGKASIKHKKLLNETVNMTTNGFDAGRRPTDFTYSTSEGILPQSQNNIDWKLNNLKNSEEIAGGITKEYTYDSSYRLLQEKRKKNGKELSNTTFILSKDEDLEIISIYKGGKDYQALTCQHNDRHQLDVVEYFADKDGKMVKIKVEPDYDNNGNMTRFIHDYTYNYRNQLVSVSTGVGVNVEYKYDALGRRIEKIVTDPNGTWTTRYIYIGWQVIEERDGSDNLKARYVYGNGIDERVTLEYEKDQTLNTYIPIHDSIGNVTALTDDTGKVVEEYDYDTFGQPTFGYDEVAPTVENVQKSNDGILVQYEEPIKLDTFVNAFHLMIDSVAIPGNVTQSEDKKQLTFNPDNPLPDGAAQVTVDGTVEDEAGNPSGQTINESFTNTSGDMVIYDLSPPKVDEIKKVAGDYIITFNERIDASTTATSIEMKKDDQSVSGTISQVTEHAFKYTPDQVLEEYETYQIHIHSTLKDLSGKAIDAFFHAFMVGSDDVLIFERDNPNVHVSSKVGNKYLFHGRTYEPEVGLYYYRHRYFMPRIGRFIQPDPLHYSDSMSLYQAFLNNPVNFDDPYGDACFKETSFLYGTGYRIGDKRKKGRELALFAEGTINLGLTASQWFAHMLGSLSNPGYASQPWTYTTVNFTQEGSFFQVNKDTRSAAGKMLGIVTDPIKGVSNCAANYYLTFDPNISVENKIQFYENAIRETPGTIMVITGLTKGTRVLARKANAAIKSNPGFQNTRVLMDEAFQNLKFNSSDISFLTVDEFTAIKNVGFIDPNMIRFSQNYIKLEFSNSDFGTFRDLSSKLVNNEISPMSIKPIRIVIKDGKIYTLDNRRLKAFQEAGVNVPYIKLNNVPKKQMNKFSTKNEGVSIIIKGEK